MGETEDRVLRLETTLERIIDRLNDINGGMNRVEGQLNTVSQDVARLTGRMDQLPGRWTFLAVLLPVSVGLFIGLIGVAVAIFRLATM